jgi:drug/metabolite transporter (DMT)-like permease
VKTCSFIGCIVLAVIGIVLGIIGNITHGNTGDNLMFWGIVAMIWSAADWVVYLAYRKAASQPPEQPKE